MKKAVFTMEPFSCPSCIKKIESTLQKIEGLDEVKVMFNSGRIRTSFNSEKTSAEEIANILTRLGYPVLSTKVS
ncbi:MAG TPA: heavy-metal-associated domain-containing protein [Alcaligenaceae bacterium]|nr:heavy-metal-associated domain-containing protein [Alcaligenaceae bacterium]